MQQRGFFNSLYCKFPAMILALCWLAGLVLGSTYSFLTIDSCFSLMRMLPYTHVSIVALVVDLLILFVIYFAACCLCPRPFVYAIAFGKAICFSYCLVGFNRCYGSAGWLLYFLVSFTDIVTIVPFLLFSLRLICGAHNRMMRNLILYSVFYIVVFAADFYIVSAQLAYIMTFI